MFKGGDTLVEKKTYKITLKSGLHSDFKADTLEQLHEKIQTGHYGILPVRGVNQEIITEENIESIEEVTK